MKFARATADFNPPETPLEPIFDDKSGKKRVTGPVGFAIDGKNETAWGIDAGPGRRNQPRKAVFTAERPVSFPGGTILTFHLTQNHGGWNSDDNQNCNLGRFRLIAGVTGFFAVLRGSTFAAHAIPNGAFAGAAGASLLGLNPFIGLAAFSVAGALGIAGLSRRARPDVATALTFVMMLGIGALFVSWSSQYAQEAYSLLFGEVFGVSTDEVLPILGLGAVSIAAIAVMFRPLMLSSALPEVAAARGLNTRRIELAFLLVMALATSMTVPVVGALLMFSLMIGPAAAARSLTARPVVAMTLSVVIALVTVWIGIAASYQSNWPLGFFVGVIGAAFFLAGRTYAAARRRLAVRPA